MMLITAALNVALNGFEAGATTKSEAKALVLENMGNSLMSVIRDMPLELVEQLSCALGAGFEMNDGRLSAVRFS